MSIIEFFPFSSDGNTWENFNGSLLVYYSQEPIPMHEEADWKLTAASLAGTPTFANYPVPDPDLYDAWQHWADDFTEIINGPSN